MGKIILEFDSFEEADDARTALDGQRWKIAMLDLDQELRKATKYGAMDNREATPEERDMADKIRESIREILTRHNLNLND